MVNQESTKNTVIIGDSGAGKTRLLLELIRQIKASQIECDLVHLKTEHMS